MRAIRIFLPLLLASLALACGGTASTTTTAPGGAEDQQAAERVEAKPLPAACEATSPRTVPLEFHALPDSTERPFVDALAPAQHSIRVMVYQMGFGPILDGLMAKAQAGVKVEVVLDVAQMSVNKKYFEKLTEAGATVHWSDPKFTFTHAKFMVIDDAVAVVSTGNYSLSYMLRERNYVVVDRDPQDVAVLGALFDADFANVDAAASLACTRLLVAPVNARERLLAHIDGAKKSLIVHSMQFGDRDVREHVAARKAAGVDVRVLLADPSWIDANAEAATFLASQGIEARWTAAPSVHVKAVVADGLAYVGSENLSYTSLSKNREVGLITDQVDAVATVTATFEKDWQGATAF